MEWGSPPATMKDAFSPQKRFVTLQTVESRPWPLFHLATAVARTREVLH